jgi:hypothetical protein
MGVEETALELSGLSDDGVLTPENWPALMEWLIKAMGIRSAMLREVDYDARNVPLFETAGFDLAYVAAAWPMSDIHFCRSPTTKSRSPAC